MKYELNINQGLLEPITYRPSPHCDERPKGSTINLVVIHGISLPPGKFGTNLVEDFFCGQLNPETPLYAELKTYKVSAHLFIKRDGEIIQFVPFSKRAWHAGESVFENQTQCNDFSIGIELEGTDQIPYELIQYQQLSHVIALLQKVYPAITNNRIVGHADIAPGRKTDPGPAFDWSYLKGLLA